MFKWLFAWLRSIFGQAPLALPSGSIHDIKSASSSFDIRELIMETSKGMMSDIERRKHAMLADKNLASYHLRAVKAMLQACYDGSPVMIFASYVKLPDDKDFPAFCEIFAASLKDIGVSSKFDVSIAPSLNINQAELKRFLDSIQSTGSRENESREVAISAGIYR